MNTHLGQDGPTTRAPDSTSDVPSALRPLSVEEAVPHPAADAGGMDDIPMDLLSDPERVEVKFDPAGLDEERPGEVGIGYGQQKGAAGNEPRRVRCAMRNDEDIERDITEELEFDPAIDPSRIRVTARDGVVSLSGFVPGYTQKYLAESAAKRVYGVRAVGDELHVELPRAGERPDTVIAEAVLCRLRWDTSVPADSIQITVDEGRVTLEGTVEWTHQRAAAERAVRGLTGVRSVRNLIQVRPSETVSADDVRRRIVEAFGRSAALGARAIKVEANDQRVVLTGNVRSWTEADTAEHVAPECPVCQKWATSLP